MSNKMSDEQRRDLGRIRAEAQSLQKALYGSEGRQHVLDLLADVSLLMEQLLTQTTPQGMSEHDIVSTLRYLHGRLTGWGVTIKMGDIASKRLARALVPTETTSDSDFGINT